MPVVFLLPSAGNASRWSAQLEHLRPHRRAVALEWRNHGRSGAFADENYSGGLPERMAGLLLTLIRRATRVRCRPSRWSAA